jgi:hypothetical protein
VEKVFLQVIKYTEVYNWSSEGQVSVTKVKLCGGAL